MKKKTLARLLVWVLTLALVLGTRGGSACAADGGTYVLARKADGNFDSYSYSYNERGLVRTIENGFLDRAWEVFAPEDAAYIRIRYRYDDEGFPIWLQMSEEGENDAFELSIENSPGESGTVQVRLHDMRLYVNGEETEVDEDDLYELWPFAISALRYADCYQNADFTLEGCENELGLREGRQWLLTTVSASRKTKTIQEWDAGRLQKESADSYTWADGAWHLDSTRVIRYDTYGRIIGITTYGDSRAVTGQFEVRYTTVENPNGGESVDFGTIVQSTNEEQNGLSYTRYYFDAEGVMVSSILYTPYVGEAALSRSMATIRDYAPDGQLLRMEGLMYMDGELVYHTLEEYTTLWDALN